MLNLLKCVLFFDEIHQIISSGATGSDSGSKGLSDILKPALSRGEILLLVQQHKMNIEQYSLKMALTRRFNEVLVNRPSAKDTVEILKGILQKIRRHHQVKLPDDVLKHVLTYQFNVFTTDYCQIKQSMC